MSTKPVRTTTRAKEIERLYELFDIPMRGDNVSTTSSQVRRAVRPPFSTPNLDFDEEEYQQSFEEAEYKRCVPSMQLAIKTYAESWDAPLPTLTATTARIQSVERPKLCASRVESLSTSSLRMRYPRDSFTPLVRLLVVQIPEADSAKRLVDWVYETRQEYGRVAHSQSSKPWVA